MLEGNGLKEFIDHDITKPPTSNAKYMVEWRKCAEKVRGMILEGVQDHIVLSLHGNNTPYLMWKALTNPFQNRIDHRKLALNQKLRKIKMEKGDSIPKYLTKFTHCQDDLGSVEIMISEDNMVSLALLGLPKSWHSYKDSINGREKLSYWERLWSNLV